MYDEAASRWHRSLQRLGYPRAYADMFARLRALGRLGSLTNGNRVLDCGIGPGDLSLALASATVAPVQIEGVAINPPDTILHFASALLTGYLGFAASRQSAARTS